MSAAQSSPSIGAGASGQAAGLSKAGGGHASFAARPPSPHRRPCLRWSGRRAGDLVRGEVVNAVHAVATEAGAQGLYHGRQALRGDAQLPPVGRRRVVHVPRGRRRGGRWPESVPCRRRRLRGRRSRALGRHGFEGGFPRRLVGGRRRAPGPRDRREQLLLLLAGRARGRPGVRVRGGGRRGGPLPGRLGTRWFTRGAQQRVGGDVEDVGEPVELRCRHASPAGFDAAHSRLVEADDLGQLALAPALLLTEARDLRSDSLLMLCAHQFRPLTSLH